MKNISFFSYKGGAGRTSLLFNTLPFLAQNLGATNTEPIIVLDLDIDSKGLSFLFPKKSAINTIQILKGDRSIGMNSRESDIRNHPFFKELIPIGYSVGLPRELDASILFASAHPTNDGNRFLGTTSNLDAPDISLEDVQGLCERYNCKAIVMDTPAGGQLSGQAALDISDKIVTVMRITKQFRDGTYEFLAEKSSRTCGIEYVVVPNVVPDDEGTDYVIDNFMDEISHRVSESVTTDNDINLSMINRNGINEVRLFKFEEKNLYKEQHARKLLEDEEIAIEKYKYLAGELVK